MCDSLVLLLLDEPIWLGLVSWVRSLVTSHHVFINEHSVRLGSEVTGLWFGFVLVDGCSMEFTDAPVG
jgi:hypothetical protein